SSTRAIGSGDGFVEMVVSETSTWRIFGLSHAPSGYSWSGVDFGLDLGPNGVLYRVDLGTYTKLTVTYMAGDDLRVAVVGGQVQYLKNGVVLATNPTTPAYPLSVDTSFYSPDATLTNVVLSGQLLGRQTPTVTPVP